MKKKRSKVGTLYAGCVAFAMVGCLAVTGMGISMVNTLAGDSVREVQAAENRAQTLVVSLQDEAERVAAELDKEREEALRQEISDAEGRVMDALDKHEREANDRFSSLEDKGNVVDGEGDTGVSNIYNPVMGEPGFNEP